MSRRRKPYVSHERRFGPWAEHYGRECDPTFKLDQLIAEGRAEMGEERWNQLQADWANPDFDAFRDDPVGRDRQLVEGRL